MLAIYLAGGDPRVPWYAKALALFVAGYALSPIDLFPDFIPAVGYLDDLLLLSLGLLLVIRLISADVTVCSSDSYQLEAGTILPSVRSVYPRDTPPPSGQVMLAPRWAGFPALPGRRTH